MSKAKINPMLAKFEAKLEAEYRTKLAINSEIDMMAMMLMLNDTLKVGQGRAEKALNDFLAWKMEIAESIVSDSDDDPEILKTKRDLAVRMKEIFGEESWKKCREMFLFTKDYWEE